ncbi:MAG TPA: SDR family oxidoreductase [Acidimicrobiales bacterium]|nr:SDR family oxidoreductase [Acidimicrobiales bacterium]
MDWREAAVVVTGASRGIGRSVAVKAAARGARVGLIARSSSDLAATSAAAGGDCATAVADVSDRRQVEEAIARLVSTLGPVDILVNNAGIGAYGTLAETDVETIERIHQVNFLGSVYAIKAVLPSMIERRHGHIVNVASIAGRIGAPFEAAYSASKFAMVGLTEALSVEVAPFGIGVSMVNPGPVDTSFFDARGHPYARSRPRKVSAEAVADAVMVAVEKERLEQVVPRMLGQAVVAKTLLPPLFRWGTRRSFAEELSGMGGPR